MKKSKPQPAAPDTTPVFPQTLHRLRANPDAIAGAPEAVKAPKRDNIFSKSRDNREDRGERQVKTTHNPQTFPHQTQR